jgi:hypothetical protein
MLWLLVFAVPFSATSHQGFHFVTQSTARHGKQFGRRSDTDYINSHNYLSEIHCMQSKSFPLNTSRSFIISAFFAFSLSHCASDPKVVDEEVQAKAEAEAPVVMDIHNKMHVVNHTKDFVDTIRFKPCGAPIKSYTTLTDSLGPKEKVMLHVHELCIDVIAEDAFQQTVFEQSDIKVTHRTTLDIK